MEKINKIIERQKDFQRIVGFPIDSNLESDRNEMSEKYIFKLIEEAIELRKEFPSVMNPWSKKQKEVDLLRVKEEMSDVLLFFINLLATWKFSFEEILNVIEEVQENNFSKVAEKKLKILNEQILNIPGYIPLLGYGNPTPKRIHLYKSFRDTHVIDETISSRECYYTHLVKYLPPNKNEPTEDDISFWEPFLVEEMKIVTMNPDVEIIRHY